MLSRPVFILGLLLTGISPNLAAQTDTALYLLGKVVMDDGTKAPTHLRVEMVCDGKAVRQSYPNESGVFSFDLGSRRQNQTATDASSTPPTGGLNESFTRDAWNPSGFQTLLGRVYLDDCLVQLGKNPGYRGTEIKLGVRGLRDDPDIGEILVSRTLLLSGTADASIPPKALQAFEDAINELSREKPNKDRVRKHLETAVRVHPDFGAAWALLGTRLLEEGKLKEAREALARAVDREPRLVEPWLGLAQIAVESGDWVAAGELSARALELDGSAPRGLLYLGLAEYYQQRYPVSHSVLGKLEELGLAERFPIAILHLGMLFARVGDIPAAAQRLRTYLAVERPSALSPERRAGIERQLQQWQSSGELP